MMQHTLGFSNQQWSAWPPKCPKPLTFYPPTWVFEPCKSRNPMVPCQILISHSKLWQSPWSVLWSTKKTVCLLYVFATKLLGRTPYCCHLHVLLWPEESFVVWWLGTNYVVLCHHFSMCLLGNFVRIFVEVPSISRSRLDLGNIWSWTFLLPYIRRIVEGVRISFCFFFPLAKHLLL